MTLYRLMRDKYFDNFNRVRHSRDNFRDVTADEGRVREFVSQPVECGRAPSVIKTLLSALRSKKRGLTVESREERGETKREREGPARGRELAKKGSIDGDLEEGD